MFLAIYKRRPSQMQVNRLAFSFFLCPQHAFQKTSAWSIKKNVAASPSTLLLEEVRNSTCMSLVKTDMSLYGFTVCTNNCNLFLCVCVCVCVPACACTRRRTLRMAKVPAQTRRKLNKQKRSTGSRSSRSRSLGKNNCVDFENVVVYLYI